MMNVSEILDRTKVIDGADIIEKKKEIPLAIDTLCFSSKRNYLNGMLVLDGKGPLPWEVSAILDVIVNPKTMKNFNYFEGVKPEVFANVILNIFGGEAKDPTWNNAGYSLLYYGMVFHQALIRLFGANKSPMAHIRTIGDMAKPVQPETNAHPILDLFKTSSKANEELMTQGTILNDALNKFYSFNALAEETKSSVVFTVENWMLKFIQSEELRDWAESETSDFDFSQILYGLKVGIALPEYQYGDAGLAIQSLSKARLYNDIKNRGNDSISRGYSRVFLFVDECQRFLDSMDLAILPEARSLELVCSFASQNINSVFEKYKDHGAKKFMASFLNLLSFNSTTETITYIQERVGKAKIITRTNTAQIVDAQTNATLQMASPLFDVSSPHRKQMKKKSFGVFKGFFTNNPVASELWETQGQDGFIVKLLKSVGNFIPSGQNPMNRFFSHKAMLTLSNEPKYIITEREVQSLKTKFNAIAVIERGDQARRDVIKTIPFKNDFTIINTSTEIALEEIQKYKVWADEEERKRLAGG